MIKCQCKRTFSRLTITFPFLVCFYPPTDEVGSGVMASPRMSGLPSACPHLVSVRCLLIVVAVCQADYLYYIPETHGEISFIYCANKSPQGVYVPFGFYAL